MRPNSNCAYAQRLYFHDLPRLPIPEVRLTISSTSIGGNRVPFTCGFFSPCTSFVSTQTEGKMFSNGMLPSC